MAEMGKSAITPVVLAYLSMTDDPWHWLLHEMANDVKMKGYVFQPSVFLPRWEKFFNEGGESDLPAYIP